MCVCAYKKSYGNVRNTNSIRVDRGKEKEREMGWAKDCSKRINKSGQRLAGSVGLAVMYSGAV